MTDRKSVALARRLSKTGHQKRKRSRIGAICSNFYIGCEKKRRTGNGTPYEIQAKMKSEIVWFIVDFRS